MSDKFHSDLRQRFGDRVPFASEFIEIPAAIEPVIMEFFERLAALDPALRVQRIWLDDGKLRIVTNGSRTGLDDIIAAAEAAAANRMRADDWHPRLPIGWFDLVHDLRDALNRDYPAVTVTAMTADRGWLHVDVDDSHLGPTERYALGRRIQGYVTQSLTTCGGCGSNHGKDRGNGRVVTCDECEEDPADA